MHDMSAQHMILAGVWVAGGIVVAFTVWTAISPLLAKVTPAPTA